MVIEIKPWFPGEEGKEEKSISEVMVMFSHFQSAGCAAPGLTAAPGNC